MLKIILPSLPWVLAVPRCIRSSRPDGGQWPRYSPWSTAADVVGLAAALASGSWQEKASGLNIMHPPQQTWKQFTSGDENDRGLGGALGGFF